MVVIATIPHHDKSKLTNFLEVSEKANGFIPKLVGFSGMRILVLVRHDTKFATSGRARQAGDFSTPHLGPLPLGEGATQAVAGPEGDFRGGVSWPE